MNTRLNPPIDNNPHLGQTLFGQYGTDIFRIDDNSDNYIWETVRTNEGIRTIVYSRNLTRNDHRVNTLLDFEQIEFRDRTVELLSEPSIYTGFLAEYFNLDRSPFELHDINFEHATPDVTEYVSAINEKTPWGSGESFADGVQKDNFGARYTGKFEVDLPGLYTFYLKSDDGSRLIIDGKTKIEMDRLQAVTESTAKVWLEKGMHDIELQYFERWYDAEVSLDWSGPGIGGRKQMTEVYRPDVEDRPEVPPGEVVITNDVANQGEKLNGSDGHTNRFVIDGNSDDYIIGKTSYLDHTVMKLGSAGLADTLRGFEQVHFTGDNVTVDLSRVTDRIAIDDRAVHNNLIGYSHTNDKFVIDGNSEDYTWFTSNGRTEIWKHNSLSPTVDHLYTYDEVVFNDRIIDLSQNPSSGSGSSGGGFYAEYFNLSRGANSLSEVGFNSRSPNVTEFVSVISEITPFRSQNTFAEGVQADNFGARYTGRFDVTESNWYTFYLKSDDGSRLKIDGKTEIEMDRLQAATEESVAVYLTAGTHMIQVEYFEKWYDAEVDLEWSGPGFGRQQMVIGAPDAFLRRSAEPTQTSTSEMRMDEASFDPDELQIEDQPALVEDIVA